MAIGNLTSADLDIFVFECDQIYNPSIMVDEYRDRFTRNRILEAIVGTTGIGLGKVIERNAEDKVLQMEPLISAKIVLRSTMNKEFKLEVPM